MSSDWATCALCPRLCRSACPVVTGSGREAATPTWIATAMLELERGRLGATAAASAASLCTDCGACQDHCHLHRPLPQLLREARGRLGNPPPVEPLRPIEGDGDLVAIEADERPMAEALARWLGAPVRRWPTGDRLGVALKEFDAWGRQAASIRRWLGSARAVVCDGGVAEALEAAGLGFSWLSEVVPDLPPAVGSCRAGGERPLACCGGAGPLARAHPDDARRVGVLFAARASGARVVDARCRSHLAAGGLGTEDLLDVLIARAGGGSPQSVGEGAVQRRDPTG